MWADRPTTGALGGPAGLWWDAATTHMLGLLHRSATQA
jgi:hypothetical protein